MLHVVLYQPEIPPNTGNVIRLCANSGAGLHLIRPLGFDLDHAKLRRAGLDYHEFTDVAVHDDLDMFTATVKPARVFALSTRGRRSYADVRFAHNDAVVFGHSHLPLHEEEDGFQIFNPGSPTERRRAPRHSMGTLRVEAGRPVFEHVWL